MSGFLGCFSPPEHGATRIELVASFGRCEGRYKRTYPASKLLLDDRDPPLSAERRTLPLFAEARKMLIHCDVAREPYARWDASLLRNEEPHHRRRRVSFQCPAFWRGAKVLGAERAAEVLETIAASGVEVVKFYVWWHSSYDGEVPRDARGQRPREAGSSASAVPGGDGNASAGSLSSERIVEETMAEIDDFLSHQEWVV